MATKINLRKLRNAEIIQFFTQLLALVTTSLPSAAPSVFAAAVQKLEGLLQDLSALFKNDPVSVRTAKMQEYDAQRDQYITGLRMMCEALTYHYDAETAAAASLLERNLSVYGGNIARQGQNTETATLNNIIADWQQKPELAGAVASLKLEGWLTALQTANKNYNDTYLQRTEEKAEAQFDFDMEQKREEAIAAYTDLSEKLKGLSLLAEDPAPWKALQAKVDMLGEAYKNTLAARAGRATADKTTEAPQA